MTVPSLDGAPIEITQSSTSYAPSVLGLPGGGFAVLYHANFDAATDPDGGAGAAVRIYDADGQPAGPAFHVALDTTGSHLPQEIIATPTGFAVLWLQSPLVGGPQVSLLQRFDVDGTRDGDPVELTRSEFGDVIGLSAAPTGEIVVIHSNFDDDTTRVSVVETNGTLSKDFEDEGMGRNSLIGGAWQAATASNGDILFLRNTVGSRLPDMSWSRDLTLHRLDADGNLLSSTVVVDDLPHPGSFLFAATSDGGAVVVEVMRTGETSELSIWKVDADGTVAAPEVSTVNETLEARSISPTADGGFLVVYLGGDYLDPAGYEVMA